MATMQPLEYSGYDDLLDAVYRTRDWWRTVYILERVLLFVGGLFGAVFVLTLLEAHLHLAAPARWCLLGLFLGYTAFALAWFVFRPLFRGWTDEEVAVHVERKFPQIDNKLINALQLGLDSQVESPGMVGALVAQTATEIAQYPVRQAVDTRRARWLSAVAAVAVLAVIVWAAASFDRFSNALQRLMMPGRDIQAIGKVRIVDVQPGTVSLNKGSDLEVSVTTQGDPADDINSVFYYSYNDDDKVLEKPLTPVTGDLYVGRVEDVKAPFSYHVEVGGSQSKTYQVTVVEPPQIVKRGIHYDFPSYTRQAGWADRFDEDTNGDVRAPAGTTVTLKLTASKPIKHGHIQMSTGPKRGLKVMDDPTQLEASFGIDRDGVYTIHLEDRGGVASRDGREYKIIVLRDRSPLIEVRVPGKDVKAGPKEAVKIVLAGRDDYGVASVALVAREGKEGPQKVIKTWTDFVSPRDLTLPFTWELSSQFTCEVGKEIFYYAVARDNHAEVTGTREVAKPQESKTAEYKITIEDKDLLAQEKAKAVSNWETELRKLLEVQITARGRVAALDAQRDLPTLHKEARDLHAIQTDIFSRTAAVGKAMKATDEPSQAVKESIELLAYGEMTQCAKLVGGIPRIQDVEITTKTYVAVAASQDKIIKVLRQLLNILPDLADEPDKDEMAEEDVEDFPEEEEEAMKDLLKNLKDMVRQQKKAVETTDELAKLPMEDYTPEEEKQLENVKAIEEKWSQFLKAKISDLSKMQDQDFANGTLLDELVEIHSEVEMAKDALQAKATEIATALEDNGLMLAEKLTKQLEKWLPDTPDRDRWQMEEPLTDGYETPMAELPKELEDLVGDLMEEEEDLQQEIEDATSAWADSMDAAGWDAMDGPISNFAANGVTGNRLPNTSELSGRSGEGRQGKSTGEFVENQFDGKGGRRTPTRLTPEAFQKGQIKDTSSTPPGGATGGGKAGGSSGEGLEGPTPPDIKMKMQSFAMRQAQLRNKAEKIALKFEVLNYPPIFEPAIKDMRVLEAALNSGRYVDARRQHNVLLKNLKGTRMFLDGELAVDAVRSPTLPAHLQAEIIDTAGAAVPEEFKEYIKGYYEAISRAK